MQKVAITGVMGAGKSTIGAFLHKKGFCFVSADGLARQALAPHTTGWHKVCRLVGEKYLTKEGFLDRSRLAEVFRYPEILKKMEAILHPIIRKELKKEEKKAREAAAKALFIEVPLLFEKNWDRFFDISLTVAVDSEKQMARLHKNRGLSTVNILARLKNQMPQHEKIKKADYVIWNNGSLEQLEHEIKKFLKKIINV